MYSKNINNVFKKYKYIITSKISSYGINYKFNIQQ